MADGKHPTCVVLRCTDFRFVAPTIEWLTASDVGQNFEDVAVAGATKNIVDPYDSGDVEFVFRQISISRKLHPISRVVLVNHLDCGVYGHGTFVSQAEERDRHIRDLTAAKIMIEHRFEHLGVTAVLARIDDRGQTNFERIM